MKRVGFLIIAVIIFISGMAQAQAPESVFYKDYLKQVLDYYPLLKKEHANIEKAVSQKALAASARLPQLWASTKFEYGNDPVYVFGALLKQNRFTSGDFDLGRLNKPDPRFDNSASIEGQWLLFDFSQTVSRVKSAGLFLESARYQGELTKMEAILAASEIYSRLAVTQNMLKVLDDVIAEGDKDVAASESLSEKGLVLGADFYLARMVQTKLMQTKNEVMAQHAALSMVFNILRGVDPALPITVTINFQKQMNWEGTAQEWIAKTLRGRLDIKAMGKLLEAQGVEENREKKSFYPKLTAYGRTDEHVHGIGDSGGGSFVVGIKATMDLFDPGHADKVKLAKAETDRLVNQYQEIKDQGTKETAETYYRLQALKDNVRLAIRARDDAMEAAQLMSPLYREGKRPIDQMLSIRASSVETYERWLKLESALRLSILSLEFYAGELDQQHAEGIYGE